MTALHNRLKARADAARDADIAALIDTHRPALDAMLAAERRQRWHRWFVWAAVAVMLGAAATREVSVWGVPCWPWQFLQKGD